MALSGNISSLWLNYELSACKVLFLVISLYSWFLWMVCVNPTYHKANTSLKWVECSLPMSIGCWSFATCDHIKFQLVKLCTHPDTEPTCTFPMPLAHNTRLGTYKYQLVSHWFDWTENRTADRPHERPGLNLWGCVTFFNPVVAPPCKKVTAWAEVYHVLLK